MKTVNIEEVALELKIRIDLKKTDIKTLRDELKNPKQFSPQQLLMKRRLKKKYIGELKELELSYDQVNPKNEL